MKVNEIVTLTEANWSQAFDDVVNAAMGTSGSRQYGKKPGNQQKMLPGAIKQLGNAFFQQWTQTVQSMVEKSALHGGGEDISVQELNAALDELIRDLLHLQQGDKEIETLHTRIIDLTQREIKNTDTVMRNNQMLKDQIQNLVTVAVKKEANVNKNSRWVQTISLGQAHQLYFKINSQWGEYISTGNDQWELTSVVRPGSNTMAILKSKDISKTQVSPVDGKDYSNVIVLKRQ